MDDYSEYSYLRNDEPVEVPYTTIPATILRHSKRDGQSVAQIYINWETFEKVQVKFTEIYEKAKIFAQGLMKLGIEKGDIVALGSDNTPEWIIAMVGIQMSGAVPLMFLFNLKDGSDIELQLLKVQDKCKAILFTAGYKDSNLSIMNNKYHGITEKGRIGSASLVNLKWAILISDKDNQKYITMTEVFKMGKSESQLPYIDPEDVAAIFGSSGSTGSPKLIPHTHMSLLITGFYQSLGFGRSSKIVVNDRPFNWIGGYEILLIFISNQVLMYVLYVICPELYHLVQEPLSEACLILTLTK